MWWRIEARQPASNLTWTPSFIEIQDFYSSVAENIHTWQPTYHITSFLPWSYEMKNLNSFTSTFNIKRDYFVCPPLIIIIHDFNKCGAIVQYQRKHSKILATIFLLLLTVLNSRVSHYSSRSHYFSPHTKFWLPFF